MKTKILVISIILFTLSIHPQKKDTLFIAFWNVENLFDTLDDPNINDEEFLPSSKSEWSDQRFQTKIKNLEEAIASMNNGRGPDFLGLCEVENLFVLEILTSGALKKFNYGIVHEDSPDRRGIDVAMLYKKSKFNFISKKSKEVNLPTKYPTRLLLTAKFKVGRDSLVFSVNHWPSRRGGEDESEKNRIEAASTLKNFLHENYTDEKIIIMGDFNDEPNNVSITNFLTAEKYSCENVNPKQKSFFNLASKKHEEGTGSYKYRDDWNMIDQIIVSSNLLSGKTQFICNSFEIYNPHFLQTHSGKYEGAPFPTYGGGRYLGGYSDHFSVNAKFLIEK